MCGCSCLSDVFCRGFGELAVPVWQPSLECAAVPSELPDWTRWRQRWGTPLNSSQCDAYVSARGWRFMGGIFPPLFISQRRATIFWWPVPLRWRWFTGQILTPLQISTRKHLPCWFLCAFVCVCSEMSSREDCRGLCSSQRAISGTLCFARWSSTWTLMGRRRCCWERMARSQLLFPDARLSLLHLLAIKSHLMMTLTVHCDILDCRSFFVTNSSQWQMKKMGSSSCSGGGASKVRCCPSST